MLCAIEKAVSNSNEKPGLIFSTATSRIIIFPFLPSNPFPFQPNSPLAAFWLHSPDLYKKRSLVRLESPSLDPKPPQEEKLIGNYCATLNGHGLVLSQEFFKRA